MQAKSRTFALALALSLPLAGCATFDSSGSQTGVVEANQSAARQAIASVLTNYSTEIMAKNLPGMEAYVLPDAMDFTIFEGKGANLGWADYRDNHLAPEFDNDDLVFNTYSYSDFSTNVSGDLATSTFSINVDYVYKGEATTQTRRGTSVLKEIGDAWKIAHLHTS